ncbi:MAG: 2Fe-2S iron-sulfur cluster-binding protein [Myxococcales bacterium]|nr:(2Fe-2S)-binding protein [Polyangiaceae bacterium]MDW8248944.1 2Fe-2S iron-sulfur cluster-binding protein [Myxococcales bacterium]
MPHLCIEKVPNTVVEADEPKGGRLLDTCDDHGAPIPFSCRSGSCGTCRVEIIEGEALLDPPEEEERQILEMFGDPPGRRLACLIQVREGPGRVRLRVVDEE